MIRIPFMPRATIWYAISDSWTGSEGYWQLLDLLAAGAKLLRITAAETVWQAIREYRHRWCAQGFPVQDVQPRELHLRRESLAFLIVEYQP